MISFIAHNQDLILNLLSVFLLFQAFLTILFLFLSKQMPMLTCIKPCFISPYPYILLFTLLTNFYNLQIISINAFLLMDYFFSQFIYLQICFFLIALIWQLLVYYYLALFIKKNNALSWCPKLGRIRSVCCCESVPTWDTLTSATAIPSEVRIYQHPQ